MASTADVILYYDKVAKKLFISDFKDISFHENYFVVQRIIIITNEAVRIELLKYELLEHAREALKMGFAVIKDDSIKYSLTLTRRDDYINYVNSLNNATSFSVYIDSTAVVEFFKSNVPEKYSFITKSLKRNLSDKIVDVSITALLGFLGVGLENSLGLVLPYVTKDYLDETFALNSKYNQEYFS